MVLSYFVSMGSKISGKYLHLVNLSPPSVYEYNKQCTVNREKCTLNRYKYLKHVSYNIIIEIFCVDNLYKVTKYMEICIEFIHTVLLGALFADS